VEIIAIIGGGFSGTITAVNLARLSGRPLRVYLIIGGQSTQRIWQHFSVEEKRRFCTRYATWWNLMRHRIAEPIHARLLEAVSLGRMGQRRLLQQSGRLGLQRHTRLIWEARITGTQLAPGDTNSADTLVGRIVN
jgi:uncharacterized NAD(P)/FAD-binding protein YdhS